MRCSVNRLLQLATKPRLQSMRSDTSSHVWPSASSKISRARRASSARFVRLLARRVSSISSEFDNVIASLMDAIIVFKWLLQSTSAPGIDCVSMRGASVVFGPTLLFKLERVGHPEKRREIPSDRVGTFGHTRRPMLSQERKREEKIGLLRSE